MPKAISYREQHIEIAREIGDRRGEGSALGNLGIAYASLGEVESARNYLQQALQIGQQIEDPTIIDASVAYLTELQR